MVLLYLQGTEVTSCVFYCLLCLLGVFCLKSHQHLMNALIWFHTWIHNTHGLSALHWKAECLSVCIWELELYRFSSLEVNKRLNENEEHVSNQEKTCTHRLSGSKVETRAQSLTSHLPSCTHHIYTQSQNEAVICDHQYTLRFKGEGVWENPFIKSY